MSANILPSELWSHILSYSYMTIKDLSNILKVSSSIKNSLKYSVIKISCREMFLRYEHFSVWHKQFFPLVNNMEFFSCTYLNPTTVYDIIQSNEKNINKFNLLIHKCFKINLTMISNLDSYRSLSISDLTFTNPIFKEVFSTKCDQLQLLNFTNSKFFFDTFLDLMNFLPENVKFLGLGGCQLFEHHKKDFIPLLNVNNRIKGLLINITNAGEDIINIIQRIYNSSAALIDLTKDSIKELDILLNNFKNELIFKAFFSCTSKSNQNVLHVASINNDYEKVAWFLSVCPYYFDSVDNRGFTPFHRAVEEGNIETVNEYLKFFKYKAKDDDKILFLSLLFRKNHSLATSIFISSIRGHYEILNEIGLFINNNNLLNSFLISQSHQKEIEQIRVKDKKGFDINIMDVINQDDKKFSPLHVAILRGSLKCCELLLKEFQCSPNYPNIYRQTPLHLAFRNERKDIIHLLVSYGGKLNLKDDDGNIPSKVKKSKTQNFLL